jgi:lipid-A-disaccharide synthase-like uncharacterized protein
MNEWFRSPAGWTVVGFAGQSLFASRFALRDLAIWRRAELDAGGRSRGA